MINSFYQAITQAQTWFFGESLMADTFFKGILNIGNALFLLALFCAVFMIPMGWAVHWLWGKFHDN